MDIYIMEDVGGYLQRMYIVDVYVSFIWTERYNAIGDFEISVFNSQTMRDLFTVDAYIWKHSSRRIMQVETVLSSMDEDGNDILTIIGRSLEKILEDRIGMNIPAGTMTSEAKWGITGTPLATVAWMLNIIKSQAEFILPWLNAASPIASGNLPLPIISETFTFPPDSLYNHVKNLCDMYNMGFGILKYDPTTWGPGLGFQTGAYVGNNRTMSQTSLEPVVFSLSMDSLKNIQLLKSNSGYKNVAYVFGLNGYAIVFADNVEQNVSGYAKKVLVVTDSSITLAAGIGLTEALTIRGKAELAKYRPVLALDGEIPQNSDYVYGVNYDLGDLVELRDKDGIVNNMNVVEQIFISDKEGERTYPTLSYFETVIPGTWGSYFADRVWDNAVGVWL